MYMYNHSIVQVSISDLPITNGSIFYLSFAGQLIMNLKKIGKLLIK